MKNLFFTLLFALSIMSCDKTSIQQTSDNIKNADSLFTKANKGIKTLDSLSRTISDSNGIAKKVIIPEIAKQKKSIDSTIKSGGWRIDSINKRIEEITKNVVVGTEVVKTLDSANNALNSGESALRVLTRTADKLLKQTKKQAETPSEAAKENQVTTPTKEISKPIAERDPLVKTASLAVSVDRMDDAKALLRQRIRENNADVATENSSQAEGLQRDYITVKVPLQNFDQLLNDLSRQLGDVKSKSTESSGKDYIASQMCDVEIILVQKHEFGDTTAQPERDSAEDAGSAFMKGVDGLQKAFIFLLPFWPVFILILIIWYFVRRSQKKKAEKELLNHQNSEIQAQVYPNENQTSSDTASPSAHHETSETDYSKYLPKK